MWRLFFFFGCLGFGFYVCVYFIYYFNFWGVFTCRMKGLVSGTLGVFIICFCVYCSVIYVVFLVFTLIF